MKRTLLAVGLVLGISLPIGGALLLAHFDEPANRIGEYQVRLNSVKVLSFDDNAIFGLDEPNPDLFIKTFTQAETHVGQVAAFGEFTDTTVGNLVGIGRLIYWHLDCPDSEKLQLIVDMADRDGSDAFNAILQAALQAGTGILAQTQPAMAPAVNKAAQAIIAAIDAELKANDQFPQISSGGFTIDDNAMTQKMTSAVGGVGMTGQYEISVTFTYNANRRIKCTDKNIFELQELIVRNDTEVKQIKERLVNLATQSGKETSRRGVLDGLTQPAAQLGYALAETDIQRFGVTVRGERVGIGVASQIEEFTLFYILGAAATAFAETPVSSFVVESPTAIYRVSKGALLQFLAASPELIGTGAFIDNLLAAITVTDKEGGTT